ncbi:alpha/beta fold hydrolase [Streptomonospora nanhaiensis]|uniref:alpha/beta fold hydrolase n=1 Tax=Streptomonospora nanhaiensis TaxID=1323731 RepID=UPI001C37EF76|nr:alpha/beta hydrolase [Streptomonospora nanhaiensis]MBV2362294.1 alpha/beta hydrolase [Streptomonospora nanhaiensis]MBX9388500.1 alpha/beta hydrolase [Streptomonospora nanhaiensis]
MDTPRIVYDRRGNGSPVLLLHGLGHHRRAWQRVVPVLARHHDVVVPDLPGFGDSAAPDPDCAYDIGWLADTVAAFCDRIGVRRPHVAGNSLGGAMALELGARGRAASVTALSPIGFGTAPRIAGARCLSRGARWAARIPAPVLRAAVETPAARALARRFLRGDPASEAARAVTFDVSVLSPGSPFLRLTPHVAGYVFQESVAAGVPVTVAWGDRDRLLPPAGARRALRRIPHARQVALLGCGHIPMADNPRAVAAEILQTCRRAGAGRPARTPAGAAAAR